jgi:prophage DNA circulation protein
MKDLRERAGFIALWIGLSVWSPALAAQAPGRARASGVTVEDVVKLAKAGLSEDIIVEQIKRKGQAFDLSSDQIIELKAAHVSDRVLEAIAADQQKTSDMMMKSYQNQSKAYDEVARRRENAILGTVDVVDPSNGKQYKIDNYSDYHWMNNQGVIAGTKTDTSPGFDWHQMVDLP